LGYAGFVPPEDPRVVAGSLSFETDLVAFHQAEGAQRSRQPEHPRECPLVRC